MTKEHHMAGLTRTHLADARGTGKMLFDASAGLVDLVERMHRTIQRRPGPLGRPVVEATRGITGFVYRSIRRSIEIVGAGVDASLVPLEGLFPRGESTPGRDVFISVMNGLYGDYLARTSNPLAIDMHLVHEGVALDAANATEDFGVAGRSFPSGRLLILVHGLFMSVQQWTHDGQCPSAALAESLGCTPLYLRYNSGLHIAANGRRFAELLETLVERWPRPVEEITIIGHSMGGLVARSTCAAGEEHRHRWPGRLKRLVFLGTPQYGAPIERGNHGLDYVMDLSPYSAPFTRLGKARSAGIRDLRHGTITAGGHRFVPLPREVDCYAVAATLGARRSMLADRLVGDGLVPLDSALGRHPDRDRALGIPKSHCWVAHEMGHLELLHRSEVYAQLGSWLGSEAP
jgi:pimeloyl-ACP methyl ester carboxylesterase